MSYLYHIYLTKKEVKNLYHIFISLFITYFLRFMFKKFASPEFFFSPLIPNFAPSPTKAFHCKRRYIFQFDFQGRQLKTERAIQLHYSTDLLPVITSGTFLMEHMVTFRKFRFYHPPTPSANEITKKYQGTFQNLPWRHPTPFFSNLFTFQIFLKTPPPEYLQMPSVQQALKKRPPRMLRAAWIWTTMWILWEERHMQFLNTNVALKTEQKTALSDCIWLYVLREVQ